MPHKDASRATSSSKSSSKGGKHVGHYLVGQTLGEGTFGKVKLGTHILTGEKVAIKILEKSKITQVADVERVSREINILKRIRHRNVIQLFEVIDTPKQIFLITEYLDGGEVFDYIVRHKRVREPEAARFFHDIVDGVDYLHSINVIHRDLKPENLLMQRYKDHYKIKVIDFGLSNTNEGGRLLKTACGSPCYAAPEMIAGHAYVGSLADLWSMGVILFALTCGYLPFEDANTSKLYNKILNGDYKIPKFVSPACRDLIHRILETNPRKRYTIHDIRRHPWFTQVIVVPSPVKAAPTRASELNAAVVKRVTDLGIDPRYLAQSISRNAHNHATTTYYLVAERMEKEGLLEHGLSDVGPPGGGAGAASGDMMLGGVGAQVGRGVPGVGFEADRPSGEVTVESSRHHAAAIMAAAAARHHDRQTAARASGSHTARERARPAIPPREAIRPGTSREPSRSRDTSARPGTSSRPGTSTRHGGSGRDAAYPSARPHTSHQSPGRGRTEHRAGAPYEQSIVYPSARARSSSPRPGTSRAGAPASAYDPHSRRGASAGPAGRAAYSARDRASTAAGRSRRPQRPAARVTTSRGGARPASGSATARGRPPARGPARPTPPVGAPYSSSRSRPVPPSKRTGAWSAPSSDGSGGTGATANTTGAGSEAEPAARAAFKPSAPPGKPAPPSGPKRAFVGRSRPGRRTTTRTGFVRTGGTVTPDEEAAATKTQTHRQTHSEGAKAFDGGERSPYDRMPSTAPSRSSPQKPLTGTAPPPLVSAVSTQPMDSLLSDVQRVLAANQVPYRRSGTTRVRCARLNTDFEIEVAASGTGHVVRTKLFSGDPGVYREVAQHLMGQVRL